MILMLNRIENNETEIMLKKQNIYRICHELTFEIEFY